KPVGRPLSEAEYHAYVAPPPVAAQPAPTYADGAKAITGEPTAPAPPPSVRAAAPSPPAAAPPPPPPTETAPSAPSESAPAEAQPETPVEAPSSDMPSSDVLAPASVPEPEPALAVAAGSPLEETMSSFSGSDRGDHGAYIELDFDAIKQDLIQIGVLWLGNDD